VWVPVQISSSCSALCAAASPERRTTTLYGLTADLNPRTAMRTFPAARESVVHGFQSHPCHVVILTASDISLSRLISRLCTGGPYLSYLSRVHRSFFSANLLQVPRTDPTFGCRSSRVAAPNIWNSLPPDSVRLPDILRSFRWQLKRIFLKKLSTPHIGKLQRFRFTRFM